MSDIVAEATTEMPDMSYDLSREKEAFAEARTPTLLPVSAVVPTINRRTPFEGMLRSLARQSAQPVEMIVVDASQTDETEQLCRATVPGLGTKIIYHQAVVAGAIEQRNQAMSYISQDVVLFLDDDILFEPNCIAHLWEALQSDRALGGVNALITNQRYFPPGKVSRTLFRILHGRAEESYAGKCIGPACNLLPEDRDDLPLVVEVEWLNTTCTLYNRQALPQPPFIAHKIRDSLCIPAFPMEDLALSLRVYQKWKLANARSARIFHDSQPGTHKKNDATASKIELVNRHYLMTRLLHRRRFRDYLKLALFEAFGITSLLVTLRGWLLLPTNLLGKVQAIALVMSARYPEER